MNKFLKIIAGFSIVLAISALIILAFNQNNEISDLKNQNETLQTERTELEGFLSILISENTGLQNRLYDLEAEHATCTLKILQLKQDKALLAENVLQYEAHILNLYAEIEELRNNQGPQDSINDLEAQVLDLQNQLAQAQVDINSLNLEIADRQAEIDDLYIMIQELSAQIEEKDAQIDSLIAQLNADSTIFKKVFDGTVTHVTASDLAGITEIRPYAFAGCVNLVSIEIPDSVTVIGDNAFYNCENLTTVVINETSNLTRIEAAFSTCRLLESFFVPKKVSYIGYSVFYTKSLSKGLTFADPNEGNLNFDLRLSGMSNITELILPEGTYEIGSSLLGNSKVEKFVIPSTVQVIGTDLIQNCTTLDIVVIKSEHITPDMFASSKTLTLGTAMYVPDSKLEEYKTSSSFNSKIIAKIKPLSEYVG